MLQLRISYPAQADLEHILAVSLERWGADGQARYQDLLAAAFRAIASNPKGPTTRDRKALLAGIRSFHIRHLRQKMEIDPSEPHYIVTERNLGYTFDVRPLP